MGHHGSYIVGHGSLLEWVNGSWVTVSDPLPALVHRPSINPIPVLDFRYVVSFRNYSVHWDRNQSQISHVFTLSPCRNWREMCEISEL